MTVEQQTNATIEFRRFGGGGTPEAFCVRFAFKPKRGDTIEVDHVSVRRLKDEKLHKSTWKVVEVAHELSLPIDPDADPDKHTQNPLVTLRVVVE